MCQIAFCQGHSSLPFPLQPFCWQTELVMYGSHADIWPSSPSKGSRSCRGNRILQQLSHSVLQFAASWVRCCLLLSVFTLGILALLLLLFSNRKCRLCLFKTMPQQNFSPFHNYYPYWLTFTKYLLMHNIKQTSDFVLSQELWLLSWSGLKVLIAVNQGEVKVTWNLGTSMRLFLQLPSKMSFGRPWPKTMMWTALPLLISPIEFQTL